MRQNPLSMNNNYKSIGEYYLSMFQEQSDGYRVAKNSIISLAKECNDIGIDFLVLLQPDLNDLSYNSQQYKCHKIMRKFLTDNDIPFHDLFEDFSKKYVDHSKKLWVSHDDSHPNSTGHKIIFQSLLKYIRNKIVS